MPPKPRITRDMIVDTAFAIAREEGAEHINARTVAERLGCSTQPVMYHFATVEALKRAVYTKADWFHTGYLMEPGNQDVLLGIGLRYIRFAIEEPHLFRLLFQSGFAAEHSVLEMIGSPELEPILSVMSQAMALPPEKAREVFLTLALFAHGYASIIANNALEFDEEVISAHLEQAYRGAVLAVQEDQHEKTV